MKASAPRLPEFVIIGAAKAATTWIVHQLQQHPQVFLPGPEPHYFSTEYENGHKWYADWFADAAPEQVIGEKSADYLAHPLAAQRLQALLPDAQLLVQLRNPIERAYSDYCMLFRRGTVGGPPEKYLQRGAERSRFLDDGLYHLHLSRFLDLYPREQIALILHEDIKREPEAIIKQVCGHLGLQPHVAAQEVGARVNDSDAPTLPLTMRRLLAPAKPIVAPLRRQSWFRSAHAALARRPNYPPFTNDLRRRLRDFYAADIEKLGPMLGRDVSRWLCVEDAG